MVKAKEPVEDEATEEENIVAGCRGLVRLWVWLSGEVMDLRVDERPEWK